VISIITSQKTPDRHLYTFVSYHHPTSDQSPRRNRYPKLNGPLTLCVRARLNTQSIDRSRLWTDTNARPSWDALFELDFEGRLWGAIGFELLGWALLEGNGFEFGRSNHHRRAV
jgi:hypothetical protein